jgi:hypothetical protein
MKPTKKGPELTGRIQKGETRNPGGLTADERAARDTIRKALASPEMFSSWRRGYLSQLEQENPLILKDYADRVGGKPKDRVELSEDPDSPLSPHGQLTIEELKAIARAQLEKEKA